MSWAALGLVALGGVLGAPTRFALDGAVTARAQRRQRAPVVPPGTLVVNAAGAFLLGVLAGSAPAGAVPLWLVAGGTGFCGSFTTFSSAAVEAVRQAQTGRWGAATAIAGVHLLASLVALAVGLALATAAR